MDDDQGEDLFSPTLGPKSDPGTHGDRPRLAAVKVTCGRFYDAERVMGPRS